MRKSILLLIGIAAIAGIVGWRFRGSRSTPSVAIIINPPSTKPSTKAIVVVPKLATYLDVVRVDNPAIPATQPLVVPVELGDAAHVVLHDPVYLDPVGHLWITRADAPPVEQALRNPVDPSEHVIVDRPVFVHWVISDNGDWSAFLVVRKEGGGYEIVSSLDRKVLAKDRAFRWESAFSWNGKIVVPTDAGVSVIEVDPEVKEHFHALPGMRQNSTGPIAMLDARGVLAWAPWENGRSGSRGVSRYVDGNWVDLPADQWPEKIVQLVPLLDGSILQIVAGEGDKVSLSIAPLESSGIDEKHVAELVEGLSNPDEDKRQAAFDELSRYGPGLWPILEKFTDEPPEARIRIKQLLRNKIAPALNGMSLIENRLVTVNRQNDGNVLFYAPVGVKIPNGDNQPQTIAPAWLGVHPGGRVDRPLPSQLVVDQRPDAAHIYSIHDDWLICDQAGVRRFIGNALVPMLKSEELEFTQVLGIDRRGRWVFQRPKYAGHETLIIDPTILDPTPRLPVWTMTIHNGSVGWTEDGYPAIKRGGAWTLKTDGWEALPDKKKMLMELPAKVQPATSEPTTKEAVGPPLVATDDGMKYFGGRDSLVSVDKTGTWTHWALPASAVGENEPTLVCAPDGLLFLFNQPGRVLRIKPSEGGFILEATFTKDIPNTEHPTRIWLDPIGRIDMVYDEKTLSVMFPSGHIPPEISQMMLDAPGR